ncbi:hypothetical protein AYI68_g4628 [Smittium mucronatum]|uniref:Uncharacterized protein n=1 Tax=Smittium mucronatum TaxID=133383 RepID=A0A1R0GWP8_9FUNG|nr:hypothetical protein AYI68_g4628 [Smittium mucronatum]
MNSLIRSGLFSLPTKSFSKLSFQTLSKCMYSSDGKDSGIPAENVLDSNSKTVQNLQAKSDSGNPSDKIPGLSIKTLFAGNNKQIPILNHLENSRSQAPKKFMEDNPNYVRGALAANSGMDSRSDKIRMLRNVFSVNRAQVSTPAGSYNELYNSMKFVPEVSVGRSIAVYGDNPTSAYRKLQRMITVNKVRKILRLKSRYEKPFVKRARLAKEANAWRVKKQVKNKVNMVLKMKGWGF